MEILKLELSDSDCELHADGLPRLIMVAVTFEGGKVKRFPWQAGKSITDLFSALGNVRGVTEFVSALEKDIASGTTDKVVSLDKNPINRGDTVKCVKVASANLGPASAGSVFLEVGKEYQVQDVFANNGVVSAYEVADVVGDLQIRTLATPDEIVLVRKVEPAPGKQSFFEKIVVCPDCNNDVALTKISGKYVGACLCGKALDE